jgi:hypothetical protein
VTMIIDDGERRAGEQWQSWRAGTAPEIIDVGLGESDTRVQILRARTALAMSGQARADWRGH